MNTGKTLFGSWTSCHGLLSRGSSTGMAAITGSGRFPAPAIPVHGLRPADLCATRDLPLGPRIETLSQASERSTLADANERRDRIHAVGPAAHHRGRCTSTKLGLDLTNTVYALDSTTKHHQGGGEDTHAARPARVLSTSDGKLHDHALDMLLPEAGDLRRGSCVTFFMCCTKPGPSSSRVPIEHRCSSRLFGADGSLDRATRPSLDGFYTRQALLSASRTPSPARRVFITNNFSLPAATICALYKSRWQVELFFKWMHLRIKQFYGTSENPQIWIAVSVYVLVAIVKKRLDLDASLYTLLQILSVTLFEKMPIHQALAGDDRCNASQITNQLNLFDF